MKAAAVVGDLDNDTEMVATLDECASSADWILALKENPGAGAGLSYTTQEAEFLLDLACTRATRSAVCIDAADQNILTYELDDPRLQERTQ
jgi:hypothetical protein